VFSAVSDRPVRPSGVDAWVEASCAGIGSVALAFEQTIPPIGNAGTPGKEYVARSCNGMRGRGVGKGLVLSRFMADFESLDPAAWLACSSMVDGDDFFSETFETMMILHLSWVFVYLLFDKKSTKIKHR
jgi:hypothetical protein